MPWAVWTIYDHPSDFPEHFVARRWEIGPGEVRPTGSFIQASELEVLRTMLLTELGLTPIPRSPGDDPVIVETWM
jgi:hypothetical protein